MCVCECYIRFLCVVNFHLRLLTVCDEAFVLIRLSLGLNPICTLSVRCLLRVCLIVLYDYASQRSRVVCRLVGFSLFGTAWLGRRRVCYVWWIGLMLSNTWAALLINALSVFFRISNETIAQWDGTMK